jgi:hypothetical protein
MDHYAADASAVCEHLDLNNAVHIGHSTGGGEVAHYVAAGIWLYMRGSRLLFARSAP